MIIWTYFKTNPDNYQVEEEEKCLFVNVWFFFIAVISCFVNPVKIDQLDIKKGNSLKNNYMHMWIYVVAPAT